jgi:TM2 domain-containing membrane protein YozV
MSNDPYQQSASEPPYEGRYGHPLPDRSEAASRKLAAGLCGILLGAFGVHKFLLGYHTAGLIMLAVTIGTLAGVVGTCGLLAPLLGVTGVMGVIGLIEGVIYLTKSDEEFYQTYMVGRREWF